MKHINAVFVLLATLFILLASFRTIISVPKSNGLEPIQMWFNFEGDELTDSRVPENYCPADENGCEGSQGVIQQLFVLSNSAQTIPDATALKALIEEAEVSPGIHNAGVYDNGKVKVIHD
jgi:hypothetical protein